MAGARPGEGSGGSPSGVEVVEVWSECLCGVKDEETGEGGMTMVGMDGG